MLLKLIRNIVVITLLVLVASNTQHMPTNSKVVGTDKSIANEIEKRDTSAFEIHAINFGNALLSNNSSIGFVYNFPSFEKRNNPHNFLNTHLRLTKQVLIVFNSIEMSQLSARALHGYYLYALCKMLI